MRSVHAAIHIEAEPEDVWLVLTDFGSYPEWNPFITSVQGDLSPGQTLSLRLVPTGKPEYSFRPKVLSVTPGRKYCWRGRTLLPEILDGVHCFRVEPEAAGTRFTQQEDFRGVLAPLLWSRVGNRIQGGMVTMNSALKERVESRTGRSDLPSEQS